ncbi:restriction endonuclease subunit S [Veillonella sp.]|uniref:restriction endonuclease subunit S n=1 Tax=Veillonella sp. TaxID=1926307 RepID=UPI0028FFBCC5|nr:restriction endonuclease subunit S [Veillonella sp.]MDU2553776.1 restriction endonuclease subunit S [Veillonella sp.]
MSKEKRRVPKLRFPGFTEDWEQRKLGSLATVEMNKRIFKEQTTIKGDIPFYKIGTFGSDADSFISRELFKEYKNKYPYPNIGDILISASGSIGRTVVYNGEDAYYQDSNIVWLNHNGKIDNSFLLQFYNQVKWAGLEGSTIKRLYNKNILETNIALPKIEEQRLIGKFFELVDRSITLHQRKLNNLKLKKKALLQKLFPKNEERYPELRFPGFTDAWEQRKLSQITVRVTRKNGNQSDLPLTISAQDGLVDQRKYFNRQVASRDMTNYYLIKKGEFAYNKSYSEGYPFGAVKRLDYYDIGALSTLYILFEITDKNISSDFLVSYYMTHLWYKEVSKRAAEGARNHGLLNISTEDFFNSELNIPNSIEEQVKIGNLIKQFDKFITLHQRKLDHLQLQKKALLQQMFV